MLKASFLTCPFGWGLALLLVLLSGCAKRPESSSSTAAAVRDYVITGEVIDVTPARLAILLHHDEIPGYMPSMTMEFIVPAEDLARLKDKPRIRARMREGEKGRLQLDRIEILAAEKEGALDAAAALLRQDTLIRGKEAYREIGETVPAFTLMDQNGDVIAFDRFRGHPVVLNFIYTRCPILTMCPASTERMVTLQRAAKAQGIRDLELVSVSLDPAYDTPPVLRDYAASHGIELSNFHLLTGPTRAVGDLLVQFGIMVEPSENFLKHTLSTILINEDGKIVHRVDGTTWDPQEFLGRLEVAPRRLSKP